MTFPSYTSRRNAARRFPSRPAFRAAVPCGPVDASAPNWQAFAKADPDRAAWLARRAPTFEFAASVAAAVARFGTLTPGQLQAIDNMMTREATRAVVQSAPRVSAPVNAAKLVEAFAAAKASGLRRIRLTVAGYDFTPAPDTGRNPGAIYVKSDTGTYCGMVKEGNFVASREVDAAAVVAILNICQDPAAAARTHGLRTGNCSCCRRELTDPVSVQRGIGPVCEVRFGWSRSAADYANAAQAGF